MSKNEKSGIGETTKADTQSAGTQSAGTKRAETKEGTREAEQDYITRLYATLDAERHEAAKRLDTELGPPEGPELFHRETAVTHWSRRLAQLRAAERGLCFGKTDDTDGQSTYIGRIGLFDDALDDPLLIDWRAPAARPFYCATAANPDGLERRRHFRTRDRTLIDFHDDLLTSTDDTSTTFSADSALLAALDSPRGGSMDDIVSTIQAEQDEIIRIDQSGVLVIEGGPGTGKTAVALHRVAYLLYHHREVLSRRGVLVVGPNPGFLDYIGTVLPSLGETDVVFATAGQLYPGVTAEAAETPGRASTKGDLSMVDVLRRAVADRQELPAEPIAVALDDVTLHVDDVLAAEARHRARATGLAHNPARRVFRENLGALLVQQALRRIGEGWLDPDDPEGLHEDITGEVRAELRGHPDFHDAVERLWPELTPQRLLTDLFTSHERLSAVAGGEDSVLELYRPQGEAWTASDAPLLDEAAELLGHDAVDDDRRSREQEKQEQEYAEGVLRILDSHDPDTEGMRASDVLDAADLAERHEEHDHRELAERAEADRTWVYGHVVVDEAQELSAMSWRVLMRRCPSRSVTIVGDLAQRRALCGADEWGSVLAPYAGDRWTHRRLSVNYRTPAEIMAVASGAHREFAAHLEPPSSVRHGNKPWHRAVGPGQLSSAVRDAIAREPVSEERSIAVIAAANTLAALDVPDRARALTPLEAKGLEFDLVLVVAPEEIQNSDEGAAADLYVALTRATYQLGIVHTGELPACLRFGEQFWSARP